MKLIFVSFLSFIFYSYGFAELDTEWWKHTILYEIIPYTFKDSNGDGIGDLKGIISKLDHFVDLGIETIHLTPVYRTTLRDIGYDITDYDGIDPRLGRMRDFETLIKEMKKRNMKLIMDLVINHSSHKHEWFQNSINRIPPYTDFYVWKDAKEFDKKTGKRISPNNWRSIFTIKDLGSAWTWNNKRKQYYFHQFLPEQPDFNLNNKHVKEELRKIITFWLNKGVAGFRLDATPFYFEDKEFRDGGYEERQLNQPETLELIHEFRLWLDEYNKIHGDFERIFIAEAHTDDNNLVQYYDKPDYPITHFPYTFLFESFYHPIDASTLYNSVQSWMDILPKGAVSAWMTQDHDGPRVGTRIIPEYGDIFTMLSMMLPGTVGVYYGQEIGMVNGFITQNQIKDFSGRGSRDPARLVMQWDSSENAGFSGMDVKTFLPPNSDYFQRNVKNQKAEKVSQYKMFKDLSTLRKTDTFKYGNFTQGLLSSAGRRNIYIVTRSYQSDVLTVVINFGTSTSRINLAEMLNNPQCNITIAAASTNAGYSTGVVLETKLANEFNMRPYSSIVFEINPSMNN